MHVCVYIYIYRERERESSPLTRAGGSQGPSVWQKLTVTCVALTAGVRLRIYMCVCIYIYIHTHMYTCIRQLHKRSYVCIYACMHV